MTRVAAGGFVGKRPEEKRNACGRNPAGAKRLQPNCNQQHRITVTTRGSAISVEGGCAHTVGGRAGAIAHGGDVVGWPLGVPSDALALCVDEAGEVDAQLTAGG